jgi:hypothetical protein
MQKNGVACLLMGGQACVVYGAAEFSRDIDLAISSDSENLGRLQSALDELQAECIAIPPFEQRFLESGQAVHFRCKHPEATNLRVDVMAKMRGVDEFSVLWDRRSTLDQIELLSLPDLVKAKKTQRDKDWPMVARLVEANYFFHRYDPSPQQRVFWFGELRNPELLLEVGRRFPEVRSSMIEARPLLQLDDVEELRKALLEEEWREREADRAYWLPLRAELERLRHVHSRRPEPGAGSG